MTRAGRLLSERLLAACDDNDEQMASVQRMLEERDREEVAAWTKQDIDLDPAEQELLFPRQQGSPPGRGVGSVRVDR